MLLSLIEPEFGLFFWMLVVFLAVLFLLKKFAWGPILQGLKNREDSIENALESAKRAKEEMANLQASNEELIKEARAERDKLLREAKETRDSIVSKAESEAKEKAEAIVAKAKEDIQNEKLAAMSELKNQVANISLEIAEKVVRKKLDNDEEQKSLISDLVKDLNIN
ncbi:MAG: F0F1 ATP synthase subunit B [Bacteroidota bacterium]